MAARLRRPDLKVGAKMSALAISCIVLVAISAGAALGMTVGRARSKDHLDQDGKEVLKMAIGLIATLAALVLGLLVASTKGTYDAQVASIKSMAADVLLLDRQLARYGPETKETRELLRAITATVCERFDSPGARSADMVSHHTRSRMDEFYGKVAGLAPRDDAQRDLKDRMLGIIHSLAQTRFGMIAETEGSIPVPFLTVLVFWLFVLFFGYGLLATPNGTLVMVMAVCAVSVAGAIFLILELDHPFGGIMHVSGRPLRDALARLGR
jgi:hypothetical protein